MSEASSSPQIQLVSDGRVIYMLSCGEYEDKATYGPYLGKQGMDFTALKNEYRADRYAAAEKTQEDYCSLSESDFVDWLLSTGHLLRIEASHEYIEISTSFDEAYVPKHWPECPHCGEGRGELEYGAVRRSLNRIATFRRCTECSHEWDHCETANNSQLPMLEDDGRDTEGGCVPFAISKACGLPFAEVKETCAQHGWNWTGMPPATAVVAARTLGFDLVRIVRQGIGSPKPPTLRQLVSELPSDRNYIIGVKQHWLAVVNGQIIDNDTNSGLGRKALELYEVRAVQAVAA